MKRLVPALIVAAALLVACGAADREAPVPPFETGVATRAWARVPSGVCLSGPEAGPGTIDYD